MRNWTVRTEGPSDYSYVFDPEMPKRLFMPLGGSAVEDQALCEQVVREHQIANLARVLVEAIEQYGLRDGPTYSDYVNLRTALGIDSGPEGWKD